MDEKKELILKLLLQNRDTYISGQGISESLGVSRTAVWKHIQGLEDLGYVIHSVHKKGYQLMSTPGTLNRVELERGLQTSFIGRELVIEETVTSTQKLAHHLAEDKALDGTVVLADEQTGGRGRLGRAWHSPKGTGIWMSLILRPDLPIQKTPQITLLTAVSVARAIQKVTELSVQIKWPNDILYRSKKLCGILTELQAEEGKVKSVIVGIGVNVNVTEKDIPEELRDIATSLHMILGQSVSRNKLVSGILNEFETLYTLYLEEGFHMIKILWESYAASFGRTVNARTIKGDVIRGMAKGITDDGVLVLVDDEGTTHHIYSADIELDKEK
jgi:BirA family transcriptional regulator, biotin operon repressor / biotin---[acetyl-CoA-carboxylase] ligase